MPAHPAQHEWTAGGIGPEFGLTLGLVHRAGFQRLLHHLAEPVAVLAERLSDSGFENVWIEVVCRKGHERARGGARK